MAPRCRKQIVRPVVRIFEITPTDDPYAIIQLNENFEYEIEHDLIDQNLIGHLDSFIEFCYDKLPEDGRYFSSPLIHVGASTYYFQMELVVHTSNAHRLTTFSNHLTTVRRNIAPACEFQADELLRRREGIESTQPAGIPEHTEPAGTPRQMEPEDNQPDKPQAPTKKKNLNII
jgi:hypothetical protein